MKIVTFKYWGTYRQELPVGYSKGAFVFSDNCYSVTGLIIDILRLSELCGSTSTQVFFLWIRSVSIPGIVPPRIFWKSLDFRNAPMRNYCVSVYISSRALYIPADYKLTEFIRLSNEFFFFFFCCCHTCIQSHWPHMKQWPLWLWRKAFSEVATNEVLCMICEKPWC